jgi:hypothetical protein
LIKLFLKAKIYFLKIQVQIHFVYQKQKLEGLIGIGAIRNMDFCLWFPPIQAASSKTTLIFANAGNIQFQTIAELVENLYAMNVN